MNQISDIAKKFLPIGINNIQTLTSGHIQTTYLISGQVHGEDLQFILQQLNTDIFPNAAHLVDNHLRLSKHIADKQSKEIIPRLIQALDGHMLVDDKVNTWRAQEYILESQTYEQVENEAIAFQGAKMVGQFNALFSDLPPSELKTIIPEFHHLNKYLKEFDQAMSTDTASRKLSCQSEIDAILNLRSSMQDRYRDIQTLPDRTCHSDTKISNILLDANDQALKIIDLDTVMAGKVVFDFGDMVRSFLSLADENEADLSKITVRTPIFEAMTEGYLSACRDTLTSAEFNMLLDGGIVITYEQSIRFLADYLRGDTYYKVEEEGLNLTRTRNQLKLLSEILKNETSFKSILGTHF